MQYTLQILQRNYQNLPPQLPFDIRQSIEDLINTSETVSSQKDAESILIAIARYIWPYNQAYKNFFEENKERMATDLILRYLTGKSHQAIKTYFIEIGDFCDLSLGKYLHKYEPELRIEITHALNKTVRQIDAYTRQELLGIKKSAYEKEIKRYGYLLTQLELYIEKLKELSAIDEYQEFSKEIHGMIEATYFGLAGLGPYQGILELNNFIEHLPGRKKLKLDYLSAYV